jgi:antitoxin VapB
MVYILEESLGQVAKVFMKGRSQAVRLPAAFRVNAKELSIRRDEMTGDIILSEKPSDWAGFFEAMKGVEVPDDFLSPDERDQGEHRPDPFEGWEE